MINQLTLNMRLRDDATFENFQIGENVELINHLRNILCSQKFPFVYLWGRGAGRTHLLQACCQMASQQNLTSIFLSLKQHREFSSQILEGIENMFLVCLDDVEAIAKNREWEEALFYFYNRSIEKNARLIISGHSIPTEIGFALADLTSRLATGLIFQVKVLNDAQKLDALKMRAKVRGIYLSDEVGTYLLNHYPRDMEALFNALDRLDLASWENKRKLTIPFVKRVLAEPNVVQSESRS